MKRIYPFVDCQSNEKVIAFYSVVNKYIDSPNDRNTGRPDTIKSHLKFSKMKFGNHRIWYHWGFNRDPKKFAPLVTAVNNNIEKGVISESDLDEFWDCLILDANISKARELMKELRTVQHDPIVYLNKME